MWSNFPAKTKRYSFKFQALVTSMSFFNTFFVKESFNTYKKQLQIQIQRLHHAYHIISLSFINFTTWWYCKDWRFNCGWLPQTMGKPSWWFLSPNLCVLFLYKLPFKTISHQPKIMKTDDYYYYYATTI